MNHKPYQRSSNFQYPSSSHLSSVAPHHSKENIQNSLNIQSDIQTHFSRYPQIESKIERLLTKIDSLVRQNQKLQEIIIEQKQVRIDQQMKFKSEILCYQKQQQEIETFVSELEEKWISFSQKQQSQKHNIFKKIRASDNQSEQLKNMTQKYEKQIQQFKSKYQIQIQSLIKQLFAKNQEIELNHTRINQSYQILNTFNIQISELKELINQINKINKNLQFQNHQLQKYVQKMEQHDQKYQNLVNLNDTTPHIKTQQNNTQQVKIECQNQEVQGLLLEIRKLEYKLQKTHKYICILEQQNANLSKRAGQVPSTIEK